MHPGTGRLSRAHTHAPSQKLCDSSPAVCLVFLVNNPTYV